MNFYRVSKYNPELRVDGKYLIDDWTSCSDIGKYFSDKILTVEEYEKIESNYLDFILECLSFCRVQNLAIKELENRSKLKWKNNQVLSSSQICDFAKDCLRENCWAKLENKNCFLHFGYDFYIYFGIDLLENQIKEIAIKHNLYVESFISPYLSIRK